MNQAVGGGWWAPYNPRPTARGTAFMTTPKPTADLCDAHADAVQVCEPVFHAFGGRSAFSGPISTVRCCPSATVA